MTEESQAYLEECTRTKDFLLEQSIIGAVLLNPEKLDEFIPSLKPEHFAYGHNQVLYELFCKEYLKGRDLTSTAILKDAASILLSKEYRNWENNEDATIQTLTQDKVQEVQRYVLDCHKQAVLISNIEGQINALLELYKRRTLVTIGNDIKHDAEMSYADASDIIEKAESKIFKLATESNTHQGFEAVQHLVHQEKERLEAIHQGDQDNIYNTSIPTGFKEIDKILGGLYKTDLVIIGGRPSMGKTALALNIMLNICDKYQKNVGIISLEMSSEQLVNRLISTISSVNLFKLKTGEGINDIGMKKIASACEKVNTLPLWINDTAGVSVSSIRSITRKLMRKHKLSALFIDYLQLIAPTHNKHNNRVLEISEITQSLKNLAKELNIPIIVLSQLSRNLEQREDKKPMLSDLRDSGAIEQDADIVCFIYREEYYLRRKQPPEGTDEHFEWQDKMNAIMNTAEVIIAKHRNGAVGNAKLYFDSNTATFKDHYEPYIRE